ncbi:hypothetical protein, partial [Pseudomonas syringae group genomosp. 7]|uniref:hypothetical protein n=1 Tax=Pseudomonas syringae group genomosp. 7 TaxID=251699 RepID=UPI0037705AFD
LCSTVAKILYISASHPIYPYVCSALLTQAFKNRSSMDPRLAGLSFLLTLGMTGAVILVIWFYA